jgi:mitochondrial fission protein ELM1
MLSLAKSLNWPFEAKRLVHNPLNNLPGLLLGASCASLDRRRSDTLAPPWPDLVIAASRHSAPTALWIKRQSGGRTKLVHLFHAQAPLDWFDLVITLPQYALPERGNVLHLTAPLNRIPDEHIAAAAERWRARLAELPRPYLALLVGGHSASFRFDAATAARLGREANAQIRASGGALLTSTSPRTPRAAADALFAALDCPGVRYRWRPDDAENPYLAFLGLADRFLVTGDSASLAIEAVRTGRPVTVFEWPARLRARWGLRGLLRRIGKRGSPNGLLPRAYGRLVYYGLSKPPRDFAAYHRALRTRGLITAPGEENPRPRQPLDDMARAVAAIQRLFE